MTSPTSVDPFAGQPVSLPSKAFPTRTHNPTRAKPRRKALVKFVYDKSGSMDELDRPVVQCSHEAVDECARDNIELRSGLLFVRDIPENGANEGLVDRGIVAIDEFKKLIASEPLIGNSSDDESQLDGLLRAALTDWPDVKSGRVKHVILVTNSGTKNATDGTTPEQAVDVFLRQGVRVHIIGPANVDAYKLLTGRTGGLLFPIPPITKDYFTSIFQTLGKTVTATMAK
ncbi:MAG: hypothetical protein BroJett014_11010 [Planctomycetota bacterium]|nr:hypothetical protein [Planctomycetota bacterium]RIK61946.1 MAG: hypothetical protein DCC64_11685 [Planctomycetota bacterium]GIK52128.1 MAG: hypothetical protein BroJett014_11010 [Planctomycetota bacterium]